LRAGARWTVLDPSGPLAELTRLPELAPFSRHINLLRADPGILNPYRVVAEPRFEHFVDDEDPERAWRRGKGLAAATVLLDGGKGALAVWIGGLLMPEHGPALCGAMAFLGHCYPIWLRFKGGKGVATMLGVSLALSWIVVLVFAIVWLSAVAISRISSLGGMSAAISAPITAWALGLHDLVPAFAAMALVVLWRHRPNIARLLRGEEPRVGSSGKA